MNSSPAEYTRHDKQLSIETLPLHSSHNVYTILATVFTGFVKNWERVNRCVQHNERFFTKTRYSYRHFGGYLKISLREKVRKNNDIPLKVTHVLSRQEKHPNTISDEYTSPSCLMQHRRLEMPGMLDSSPMGDHVPLIGYQCPHPQEQCPRWVPTQ